MLFPWSTVYGLSQYQDSWEARCAASQCSCSCRLDWDGKHLDYYFSELMGSSSEQRCTCTFLSWFWGRRRKVKVMEGEEGKAGIPTKKKKKSECGILCREITDIKKSDLSRNQLWLLTFLPSGLRPGTKADHSLPQCPGLRDTPPWAHPHALARTVCALRATSLPWVADSKIRINSGGDWIHFLMEMFSSILGR